MQGAREKRRSPVAMAASKCQVAGPFGHFRCWSCKVWKHASCFSLDSRRIWGHRGQCKQCAREYDLSRRMTLRGHVQSMLNHARGRHKRGKWHGNFEIDLDSVLKMLWSQQGRCFYSDVPMRFAQVNVDCMMSLERLDNSKTYTTDNTVLVALEFNTADHSSRAVSSAVFGSSQWSRSKVDHVWENLESIAASLEEKVDKGSFLHLFLGGLMFLCGERGPWFKYVS